MKTTSFERATYPCKTEKLFEQLRGESQGWERSKLLLQLIEEMRAGRLLSTDLVYPTRSVTWSESTLRNEEDLTRLERAKASLYSVLVDDRLSFEARIATLQFLVEGISGRRSPQRVSQEEIGVHSGDLALLGKRIAALHQSALPAALDSDRTSVRRAPCDQTATARARAARIATRLDADPPADIPRAA